MNGLRRGSSALTGRCGAGAPMNCGSPAASGPSGIGASGAAVAGAANASAARMAAASARDTGPMVRGRSLERADPPLGGLGGLLVALVGRLGDERRLHA